jgi:hypothetical protein
MATFRTDEILWYNVGVWGQLGYACPNFGENPSTVNNSIAYLVQVIGRNLSAVMHHGDVDSRTPPTINTLMRVHKLVTRARSILAGRAVPANKPRFEPVHATPAPEVFLVFPVPYFKARNVWLKEWCALTLNAIGEACQHTDNRVEFEISLEFAGLVGQYLQRVYVRMATELFQVALADAEKPDFALTDAHFQGYNPAKFFTSTELIDTVPPLDLIPTEDDLAVLTDGIPANMLTGLSNYPRGTLSPIASPVVSQAASKPASVPATAAFAPPPGP